MRRLTALPLFLCCLSPALASGGLSCSAEDEKVTLSIDSGVTRGMGGPLFNFRASASINDPAVPEDLRSTSFDHATQYWLDGKVLNLLVYWEREADKPHGYVEITVMTAFDNDDTIEGTYEISVFDGAINNGDPLRFSGTASCFVE